MEMEYLKICPNLVAHIFWIDWHSEGESSTGAHLHHVLPTAVVSGCENIQKKDSAIFLTDPSS